MPLKDYIKILNYHFLRRKYWQPVLCKRARALTDDNFISFFPFSKQPDEFINQFTQSVQQRFFFNPGNRKDFFFHVLTQTQSYESITQEADDVVANRFQALGSVKVHLGDKINWQKDYKSGYEWKLAPSETLDIIGIGNSSDIKFPWELNRFHWGWQLGKAYWLTNREEYAEKFKFLIEDWIEQNPIGYGVNWVMPMEAAIRTCNWIAGYYLFCESKSFSSQFWLRFFKSLYAHGIFIRNNLEYTRRSGNHLIADLTGLIFLGNFFSDAHFGKKWLELGKRGLEEEMERQVLPDGVYYEKSISYHRLALEMLTASTILLDVVRSAFSESFKKRLEKMFEFTMHYSRPDGSTPLIGDADDGRLYRFTYSDNINDHRHLLCCGALLFKRSDFKTAAGGFSQDALWYFGGEGFERYLKLQDSTIQLTTQSFLAGGYYVLRSNRAHVLLDAGELGKRGWGGHGHNDTLSFELWMDGVSIIVDSGTYTYTGDVKLRNQLRCTAAHNTIMVDGNEISDFSGLFKIKDRTNPVVLKWQSNEKGDILIARHFGYKRLKNPVVVTRSIVLKKEDSTFEIYDVLEGKGEHSVELFFHLHPKVEAQIINQTKVRLTSKGSAYELSFEVKGDGHLMLTLEDSLYAPSYGVLLSNKCIRLTSSLHDQPLTIISRLSPTKVTA